MSFKAFRFHAQIQANIEALGFVVPTPIQKEAIPAILKGQDLVGLAQTGTGKTAAYVLPLMERLMRGARREVRGLIIAPTRELAEQINTVIHETATRTGIYCTAVYGGTSMERQIHAFRHGVEIVVACPGRLLDHMHRRTINLSHVEYLVLDEADRLFDMGFMPDIRRIVQQLPPRQTLLFSATMPPPIRKLANDFLKNPVTVQIAHSMPAATVTHAIFPITQPLKTALLLAILNRIDRDSVLIFARTRHRTERLAEQLQHSGHSVSCLQGDMSQRDRDRAMEGFRDGRFQILVATDIAARGLDVTTISHVINYDMPDTVDSYTHRIGRTGRAAKTGDAFTLVTSEDEDLVRGIEKILGHPIPRRKLEGFDYTPIGAVTYRRPTGASQQHRAAAPAPATATTTPTTGTGGLYPNPARRRRNPFRRRR